MMKRNANLLKIIAFTSICFILAGCAGSTENNLNTHAVVSCNTDTTQFQNYTPDQHYQAMLICIKEGDRDLTVVHYAMAGATTWYEAKVSGDTLNKTRHQQLLKQYIKGLPPQNKSFLGNAIRQVTEERALLGALCKLIKSRPGVSVTQSVLAEEYWKEAVNGYLRCPDPNS